ncbi:MAG: serine/threonine protein kinase, partial [Betaproteobacteria bacterium]
MLSVDAHPYSQLTPDRVLDAVDAAGMRSDGRLLSLNSYENRVYQVWLEDTEGGNEVVVAKFYRPGRWSDAQIDEEHDFARELAGREIPVVAPIQSIQFDPFRVAIYPRRGGRTPELGDPKTLEWIGRFIGRIHAVGATKRFAHRESISVKVFGHDARAFILQQNLVPAELAESWKVITEQALAGVERCFGFVEGARHIRLHGDCHPGNILWTDYGEMSGPHFVDLDDSRMGPAIQDLWMLLSGDRAAMSRQLHHVLAGYQDFAELDRRELHLVEALRTLRLIHYSAWIARRWDDPAFPAAFP